jgi:HK97 family phage prohead protease
MTDIAHKAFEAIDLKATGDRGEVSAIVAVFGNRDRGNDRIIKGAFQKSIQRWQASGDPVPFILSHEWSTPDSHLGVIDPRDMKEVDRGLFVKAKMDIADNPVASRIFKLLRRRSLKEFSFGYAVMPGGERTASDGANELTELDLVECGPTLKGMNPSTELLGVKAMLLGEPQRPEREYTPSDDEKLRRRAQAAGIQIPHTKRGLRRASEELRLASALGDMKLPAIVPDREDEPDVPVDVRDRVRQHMLKLLTADDGE